MSSHDEEQIVRGYDPLIMKRLLLFLKPYVRIVVVASAALLAATGAELLLPLIMQRTIDRHIVVRYYRVDNAVSPFETGATAAGAAPGVVTSDGDTLIGEWLFVRESRLKTLPDTVKEELRASGHLGTETWYVFPTAEREQPLRVLLQSKPGLFELGAGYGAIRSEDLRLLTREERRQLRSLDLEGVAKASVAYLLLLVGVLVLSFVQVYLMTLVGQKVMRDMRLKLFSHTIGQSLSYLNRTPVGSLVTRVTNDIETLSELFTNVATAFFKDIAVLIGVILALFLLNSRLALVVLLTTPPTVLATWYFRIKGREAYRKVRLWVSHINTFLSEHISGMDVVQMLGREARSMQEFLRRNGNLLGANLSEVRVMAYFRPLIDMFTSISIGVVLYFGAGMRLREAVSLGVLIAFINLVGRFYRPIQDISEKFTVLQSAMAGGERVFSLLDANETIAQKPATTRLGDVQGRIDLEHVTFGYNPEDPILKDVSFTVMPGETVALVGYTGAGKTTVFNLLVRFWDIQSGSVKIDGVDIRDLALDQLRAIVQPVQQDVFLFSGTIEDNLTLGRDIRRESLMAAAEAVEADGFIRRMPHGYNTELQESGANLSSGQRQLLSFARTIAGDPRVIILDEATSNIDTETERLVQSALGRLLQGRTSIVIAHRLSTIRHADRIIVLSHGRVAEIGTHAQLMENKGLYHSLYKLQYEETHHGRQNK